MNDFRGLIRIGVILLITTLMSFGKLADYRFSECSGISIKNHVGNSLDGVLSGNVSLAEGESSLSFSSQGKMVVEHSSRLDLTKNLSIAFWIKPLVFKRQALIVRGEGDGSDRKYGSNAEYSLVLWEDGRFKYKHNRTADTFSSSVIPKNKWTHIVLVRNNDSKKLDIYINGVLDASNTYTISPSSSNSEKLLIGTGESYSSTMGNLNGKIDEIKIYNIILNEEKISDLYSVEKDAIHLKSECVEQEQPPLTTPTPTPVPTASPTSSIPVLLSGESSFSIGNKVWFDADEDGLQSSKDKGVEGIIVTLYDKDNNEVKHTTTNASGIYQFFDIEAGSYSIEFSNLPKNYIFTEENVGANDNKDSDVDIRTGRTEAFTLEENDLSLDAGIIFFQILNDEPTEVEGNVSIPPVTVVGEEDDLEVIDTADNCKCKTYTSSIPSMGQIGIALMLFLTSIIGVFFIRRRETLDLIK